MSTLISFSGCDKTGAVKIGHRVVTAASLSTFVNTRFGDGWTTLVVHDLDRGRLTGGITHDPKTNARTWWTA